MKTRNKNLALVTLLLIMSHSACSAVAQTVKTAIFPHPSGVALDSKGNIYVTRKGISKITPDGNVSTFAGADSPNGAPKDWSPYHIAVDRADNLYVIEYGKEKIYKVTSTGVVSILTNQAKETTGIAVDREGTIYYAVDGFGFVGKISSDGTVANLAGRYPATAEPIDGTGDAAGFKALGGLAVDNAGNVFVTDGYTIRKITPAGVVTTIAGAPDKRGHVDGPGSTARFIDPRDIAVDNADNLYISDQGTIRKITPDGVVSTVAGKPGLMFRDGGFERPSGLAVDKAGNVYVADAGADVIRKISAAGMVSTLAGKYHIDDEELDRQEEEKRRHGR